MHVSVRMSENGRVLIPADIRKQLGLIPGELIRLTVDGQELRLMTRRARLRAAQDSVARYIEPGRRLEDELIAERREQARKELEDE